MLIKILYCMGYQIISPTYLMYTECNLLYRHVTYITYTYSVRRTPIYVRLSRSLSINIELVI